MTQTPRAVILGGGIGSLAAAGFLHRAGIQSTVNQQAQELKEVVAGLVVTPNAARLLRHLGLMEEFAKRAVAVDVGFEARRVRRTAGWARTGQGGGLARKRNRPRGPHRRSCRSGSASAVP